MRVTKKTLSAGVAALALLAGSSMALAQDAGTDHIGKKPPGASSSQTRPTQSMNKMKQRSASQRTEHVRSNNGNPEKNGTTAQRPDDRSKASADERRDHANMTENQHSRRGNTAKTVRSERNADLKGLQGNTSLPMQGADVHLNDTQRTTIRETIVNGRAAPRVGHVDFDVKVGTVVPGREIHVVPVPEMLVRIEPRWRGYRYFVYKDEVIIINPRDMRIVAVLPV